MGGTRRRGRAACCRSCGRARVPRRHARAAAGVPLGRRRRHAPGRPRGAARALALGACSAGCGLASCSMTCFVLPYQPRQPFMAALPRTVATSAQMQAPQPQHKASSCHAPSAAQGVGTLHPGWSTGATTATLSAATLTGQVTAAAAAVRPATRCLCAAVPLAPRPRAAARPPAGGAPGSAARRQLRHCQRGLRFQRRGLPALQVLVVALPAAQRGVCKCATMDSTQRPAAAPPPSSCLPSLRRSSFGVAEAALGDRARQG